MNEVGKMTELVAALGELSSAPLKEEHVMVKRKYPGRKLGSKTISKEEFDGIVVDYKAGMLFPDLVAKYKRSKSAIWRAVHKAGLPLRRRSPNAEKKQGEKTKGNTFLTDEEHAQIVEDYKSGMLLSKITAKYERSRDSCLRAVRMAGVPLRGRGWTNGSAKVTELTKVKMRKQANQAAVATSIAFANKALAKVHKNEDVVGRAVSVLIKSLEHEEIQEILIDFNSRQYKTTRLRVEEGRAV